jgi:hypothetical protein
MESLQLVFSRIVIAKPLASAVGGERGEKIAKTLQVFRVIHQLIGLSGLLASRGLCLYIATLFVDLPHIKQSWSGGAKNVL